MVQSSEVNRRTQRLPALPLIVVATLLVALVYDPKVPATFPKRTLILGLGVVLLAVLSARVWSKNSGLLRFPNWGWLSWVGFVAWSGISIGWSKIGGFSDLATWVGATLVGLFLISVSARQAIDIGLILCALVGGFSALMVVGQYLWGARGMYLHAGQGNPNWLGLLLAVTAIPATGLAFHRFFSKKRFRWWALMGAAMHIPGLALAQSRVAAVALLIGVLVWLTARRAPRVVTAVVVVGSVLITLLMVYPSSLSSGERNQAADQSNQASVFRAWHGRVWIWSRSAETARAHLPSGTGLGDFAHDYLDAQGSQLRSVSPAIASRRFINATTAHNDWLQVTVESGWLGLFLFALAIGFSLYQHAAHGSRESAAALATLSVCALGDSPIRQPSVVIIVVILMLCAPATARLNSWAAGGLFRVGLIGLLAVASGLLVLSTRQWLAMRIAHRAKEAPPTLRLATLERAARLAPRSGQIALDYGLALAQLEAPNSIAELRRSRRYLANVGTDVAIGNVELSQGRTEQAVQSYERALRRHPGYFKAHANLTVALTELGQLDQAQHHLTVSRTLLPGHPGLPEIAERLRKARVNQSTSQ